MTANTSHQLMQRSILPKNKSRTQGKMRGQRGRLPVQPLGYVMSTKVILRRAEVFVLAKVCLSRRPYAGQPRSDVWKKSETAILSFHWEPKSEARLHADVSIGRQTSARTKTLARPKISFLNMQYHGQRPEPPSLSPDFLSGKIKLIV